MINEDIKKDLADILKSLGGEADFHTFTYECTRRGMDKRVNFAEILTEARIGHMPFIVLSNGTYKIWAPPK